MGKELVQICDELGTGDKSVIRENIMDFESFLSNIDGAIFGDSDLLPLKHSFPDEMYVREIFVPAGTMLTGKIHKHAHPNFLMSGEVEVVTESGGRQRLKAPMSMISPAGTKRVVYAHTDVVWVTVHHNPENTTDLKKLEDIVIAKNYLEYENYTKELSEVKNQNALNIGSEIKNCGLVALKNLSELKNISARTLIDMAEDNGLVLYPYKVDATQLHLIPFPAIVHSTDHFDYIATQDDLKFDINYTGNILLTQKAEYTPLTDASTITGSTWAGIVIAGAGLVGTTVGAVAKGSQAKKARVGEYKKLLTEKAVQARKEEEANKQKTRDRNNNIIIGASVALLVVGTFIFLAINNKKQELKTVLK